MKIINCNTSRISEELTYKRFKKYDNIIVESGTGSGKSFTFSMHLKRYLDENPEVKLLSIFGKRNLGIQQRKYFEDQGLDIKYYLDDNFCKNHEGNILCCINSLYKYESDLKKNAEKYILFIDEISLFTVEVTHNSTIRELKRIYVLLKYLIQNCKKLYVCQNEITDSAMLLISSRLENKTLCIKNNFKTNANKEAIKFKNENLLVDKMLKDIQHQKYFLFCSDSKKIVDKLFLFFTKNINDEEKKKYVKFTSDSKEKITNDFVFQNKYVFYSPTISAGVDVSLDIAQNQYMYITGKSVDSMILYQMGMRTRNLEKLYYYCKKTKKQEQKYSDVEDCKKCLKDNTDMVCNSILRMCFGMSENEEKKFVANSFFDLFAENEYIASVYASDIIKEFENILMTNGFRIISNNDNVKDYKDEFEILKKEKILIDEQTFNNFCEDPDTNKELKNTCELLCLESKEEKETFKHFLSDSYKLRGHFNCIHIFSTNEYLDNKIEECTKKIYDSKLILSPYVKIRHLKEFMKTYDINIFDMMQNHDENIEIKENHFYILKSLFELRSDIKKRYDLIQFITKRFNSLCDCELIKSKRIMFNDNKISYYYIDDVILGEHFDLYSQRGSFNNIEKSLITYLNIEIPKNDDFDFEDFIED